MEERRSSDKFVPSSRGASAAASAGAGAAAIAADSEGDISAMLPTVNDGAQKDLGSLNEDDSGSILATGISAEMAVDIWDRELKDCLQVYPAGLELLQDATTELRFRICQQRFTHPDAKDTGPALYTAAIWRLIWEETKARVNGGVVDTFEFHRRKLPPSLLQQLADHQYSRPASHTSFQPATPDDNTDVTNDTVWDFTPVNPSMEPRPISEPPTIVVYPAVDDANPSASKRSRSNSLEPPDTSDGEEEVDESESDRGSSKKPRRPAGGSDEEISSIGSGSDSGGGQDITPSPAPRTPRRPPAMSPSSGRGQSKPAGRHSERLSAQKSFRAAMSSPCAKVVVKKLRISPNELLKLPISSEARFFEQTIRKYFVDVVQPKSRRAIGQSIVFAGMLCSDHSAKQLLLGWSECLLLVANDKGSDTRIGGDLGRQDSALTKHIRDMCEATLRSNAILYDIFTSKILYWSSLYEIARARAAYGSMLAEMTRDRSGNDLKSARKRIFDIINSDLRILNPNDPKVLKAGAPGQRVEDAAKAVFDEVFKACGIGNNISKKTRNRQVNVVESLVECLGQGVFAFCGIAGLKAVINELDIAVLGDILGVLSERTSLQPFLEQVYKHLVGPILTGATLTGDGFERMEQEINSGFWGHSSSYPRGQRAVNSPTSDISSSELGDGDVRMEDASSGNEHAGDVPEFSDSDGDLREHDEDMI